MITITFIIRAYVRRRTFTIPARVKCTFTYDHANDMTEQNKSVGKQSARNDAVRMRDIARPRTNRSNNNYPPCYKTLKLRTLATYRWPYLHAA